MNKYGFTLFALAALLSFSASAQYEIRSENISSNTEMNYFLYLPDDYSKSPKTFPLLLFLHGGGESGMDTTDLTVHGPPKLVKQGRDFPFIILAPQNPYVRKFWDEQALIEILERTIQDLRVDTSRIYLSGLSRGGLGAWTLAIQYPEYFAALLPICGVSVPTYSGWLPDIPIWIFHGEDDPVVPVSESIEMYEALKEAGRNVKLTLYPETGHDSWTKTYENPEVYEWMLKQRR